MAWCFEDEANPYAERVLDQLALDDREAVVPGLWTLEVVNVLLVAERRKRLGPVQSRRFSELLMALPITVDQGSLHVRSPELLSTGRECELSTYDASYVELAERLGLPIATGDEGLKKAAGSRGIEMFLADAVT